MRNMKLIYFLRSPDLVASKKFASEGLLREKYLYLYLYICIFICNYSKLIGLSVSVFNLCEYQLYLYFSPKMK